MYLQGLFMLPINVVTHLFVPQILRKPYLICFYINFELCVLVSTFQMTYLTYEHDTQRSALVFFPFSFVLFILDALLALKSPSILLLL